jgi:hypothetical protein
MCLYDPPLLLGTPDLSAAAICALPLAASAARWSELLSSFIGLTFAFLAAHLFMVAFFHEYPPSLFYWMREQVVVVPVSLVTIAFDLLLLYAASQFIRGLWQGEHRRAAIYLLVALVLVAAVMGSFAYLFLDARAFEQSTAELLAINVMPGEQNVPSPEIIITSCVLPPFDEGTVGYSMLAVLVIFEILVAVGIADALNLRRAQSAQSA